VIFRKKIKTFKNLSDLAAFGSHCPEEMQASQFPGYPIALCRFSYPSEHLKPRGAYHFPASLFEDENFSIMKL